MGLVFLEGIFPKLSALLVFLLASFTDYWDGTLARQRNQITNFGKLLDPVADKILTLSAFMAFVQMRIIPAWMVVLIMTRDLLITGVRLLAPRGAETPVPSRSGKHKTVLQFSAITGVLVFLVIEAAPFWKPEWSTAAGRFIYAAMIFVVGVTLWSGATYLYKNKNLISQSFR